MVFDICFILFCFCSLISFFATRSAIMALNAKLESLERDLHKIELRQKGE